MTKLFKRISYLLILSCILNCVNTKSQNGLNSDLNIELDSVAVKEFLEDPRNNLAINKLEYETECKLSENQDTSNLEVTSREYHDCTYIFKGKKVAEMKSSVFKTDSTWPFGTNGLEIYLFQTDQESFPLKNNLKVGATIEDFQNFLGIQKKLTNKYYYEFEFELFSSKLNLEYDENIVTKITVANTVYNSLR
ncbi:hypothetical protein ACU8DI_14865 [Psychroserpens sp. BH13MA-6]